MPVRVSVVIVLVVVPVSPRHVGHVVCTEIRELAMVSRRVQRAVVGVVSGRRIIVVRVMNRVPLGLVGCPGQDGHVGAALAANGAASLAVGVQARRGPKVVRAVVRRRHVG